MYYPSFCSQLKPYLSAEVPIKGTHSLDTTTQTNTRGKTRPRIPRQKG